VFVKGTTAGLLINENNRMLVEDFHRLLTELAPEDRMYQHPENAHSHLRASLLNNNLTIPIANNELFFGTWQSILMFEFDVAPREREIIVTIQGV
jgi:secondary thiamine-phosphate synthase enzyme